MRQAWIAGATLCAAVIAASMAGAADRLVAYNLTTATEFKALYLAPAGTRGWGPNQVLNDKDKVWDSSERLRLTGVTRGRFDARLIDSKGRTCTLAGVDLTRDTSFDVRDADLASCH